MSAARWHLRHALAIQIKFESIMANGQTSNVLLRLQTLALAVISGAAAERVVTTLLANENMH